MAGKKFSLEAMLTLADGVSMPLTKMQTKLGVFGKTMKKHFGGLGNDIQSASKWIDKSVTSIVKYGSVAAAAAVGGAAALIESTAKSADEFIKQARVIGITSEELQALTYAADLQGVSSETLNKSLEKMMKNVGELRNGEGMLGKYLASTDRSLLKQIQSSKSSEEVFTLLMDKMSGMTDEFARAQFAQIAFGKSGMDMIKMANGGQVAILELLAEAHKYGLVTNSASESSEAFLDEQARLKAMLLGVKNQAFNALIPKLAELITGFRKLFETTDTGSSVIERFKKWVEGIDVNKVIKDIVEFGKWIRDTAVSVEKLIEFLSVLGPYLLIVAAGIKIAAAAMAVYKIIASKPDPTTLTILAIIAAVAALIVIIKLVRDNWGEISAFIVSGLKGVWDVIKSIGASILDVILLPLRAIIGLVSKLPGMGEKLKGITEFMDSVHGASIQGRAESGVQSYASPSTSVSESRTYSESRSSTSVYVRPDRGAAISTTRGGAPVPSLSYGRSQ